MGTVYGKRYQITFCPFWYQDQSRSVKKNLKMILELKSNKKKICKVSTILKLHFKEIKTKIKKQKRFYLLLNKIKILTFHKDRP